MAVPPSPFCVPLPSGLLVPGLFLVVVFVLISILMLKCPWTHPHYPCPCRRYRHCKNALGSEPQEPRHHGGTPLPLWEPRVRLRCARARARAQVGICVCVCDCVCEGRGQPCQPCECDKRTQRDASLPAGVRHFGRRGQTGQAVRRPKPATASPSSSCPSGFEVGNNGPVLTTSAGFTSLGTGA